MRQFEGNAPSDVVFGAELKRIQEETRTKVKLERTPERNLIRNSGQYWKALGLLQDTHGSIQLTSFGRKVADGQISPTEFAATVIRTLSLPNDRIQQDRDVWKKHGIRIRPLELILRILDSLARIGDGTSAFITPAELTAVVIPLAAVTLNVIEHVNALVGFREGKLDVSGWPDCAPGANDHRMAREFLLFLANYGFCERIKTDCRENEKYILRSLDRDSLKRLLAIQVPRTDPLETKDRLAKSGVIACADRRRVLMEILARPHQGRFRRQVLEASKMRCLITGSRLQEVLEAAHIIPVSENGPDTLDNGLCMRADVHLLFDSGHLGISRKGAIRLSQTARDACYSSLPKEVEVPDFVDLDKLEWRQRYC